MSKSYGYLGQKKKKKKLQNGEGKWPLTPTGPGEGEAILEQGLICLPCHLLTGA